MLRRSSCEGFTLIEVMVGVTIVSVASLLAIPAYQSYVRSTRVSEVSQNFDTLFKHAAARYAGDASDDGAGDHAGGKHCSPPFERFKPDSNPGVDDRPIGFAPTLNGLGMPTDARVFYSYGVLSDGTCKRKARDPSILTFIAIGDLDGDDLNSEFSLAVGSDNDNRLYHGEAIYKARELE